MSDHFTRCRRCGTAMLPHLDDGEFCPSYACRKALERELRATATPRLTESGGLALLFLILLGLILLVRAPL